MRTLIAELKAQHPGKPWRWILAEAHTVRRSMGSGSKPQVAMKDKKAKLAKKAKEDAEEKEDKKAKKMEKAKADDGENVEKAESDREDKQKVAKDKAEKDEEDKVEKVEDKKSWARGGMEGDLDGGDEFQGVEESEEGKECISDERIAGEMEEAMMDNEGIIEGLTVALDLE